MDFKPSYLNFFGIVNYVERDRSGEKQKKIIPRETITYSYLNDLIIVSIFEESISDSEKKLLELIARSIREEPLELKKISEIGDNQNLFSQVGKLIIDNQIKILIGFGERLKNEYEDFIDTELRESSLAINCIFLPSLGTIIEKPELKRNIWEKIKFLREASH